MTGPRAAAASAYLARVTSVRGRASTPGGYRPAGPGTRSPPRGVGPGARAWRVGIRDPRGAGSIAQIELHDNEAVGTSGDYQRYFMKDGKRRPHIIDPRTGYPIDLVASVTIITSGGSDVGLRSDGNSKPLFITGPAGWEAMSRRLGLNEVMMVDTTRRVLLTPAMRSRLEGS